MMKLLFLFAIAQVALFADLPKDNLRQLKQIKCRIAPHHSSKPHKRLTDGTSANWSGYAALTNLKNPAKGSVSYVSGYWTVPTLSPTSDVTYSSIWVGIDGYASPSVEQIGTEHDWDGRKQINYAWFEMYPQGSYEIVGFPVDPNDQMAAEVSYVGNSTFQLTLYNYTKKVYTTVPSSYTRSPTAQRSSAEWIVEAPSDGRSVLPLADFNQVAFTNCKATINNTTGPISNSHWQDDELLMATQSNIKKANPSSLTDSGENFTVNWDHE